MPTTPASAGGFEFRRSRFPLLWAVVALSLAFGACEPVLADPLRQLIGSVSDFANGSNYQPNPIKGTWTLGDKDFTYLKSSNWTGIEKIEIQENIDVSTRSHEFLISNLSGYTTTMPLPLELDYRIHINGSEGPFYFANMVIDSTIANEDVEVWKDIFMSHDDYTNNVFTRITSLNGNRQKALLPTGLTDLWIRDTIRLSGAGKVSSVNNVVEQTMVPEIDPASFGSVLALVLGAFSFLERRTRRALGMPAVA